MFLSTGGVVICFGFQTLSDVEIVAGKVRADARCLIAVL